MTRNCISLKFSRLNIKLPVWSMKLADRPWRTSCGSLSSWRCCRLLQQPLMRLSYIGQSERVSLAISNIIRSSLSMVIYSFICVSLWNQLSHLFQSMSWRLSGELLFKHSYVIHQKNRIIHLQVPEWCLWSIRQPKWHLLHSWRVWKQGVRLQFAPTTANSKKWGMEVFWFLLSVFASNTRSHADHGRLGLAPRRLGGSLAFSGLRWEGRRL